MEKQDPPAAPTVKVPPSGPDGLELPRTVVIIPIVNSPIFPGMIAPIILTEDKFTSQLDHYLSSNVVALNLVKDGPKAKDSPEGEDLEEKEVLPSDIYRVGVLCKVVKKLKLPDGSVNLLVHGIKRYRAIEVSKDGQISSQKYETFEDIVQADEELDAYTRSVINQIKRLGEINPYFNEEMKLAILNSPSPGPLADLVAFALSLDIPEAQDFLETLVVKKRFAKLLAYLKREKEVADIQKKISDEVNSKVNKYQREYFLREQLKVIRSELGLDDDDKSRDLKIMREKLKLAGMSGDAHKVAEEEMDRLEVIPDSSPEYNTARTYLNWMLSLPWSKSTEEKVDIALAQKVLERDHFGLEKAKERILEFLAVRKLRPQYDGTILCFAGPPGVGKTSLGKSIAHSLGRKFCRLSLGGMRDEGEIKGHRRTYVGAMPGRIIQALKRAEVNNPVIMLDEIDKLGQSFQGDPASALLEVLDPEQNASFLDYYLDVPFDLSKVLFIATANYMAEIPEPLLDRMETIELSGYTIEEKVAIATKWVIPKQLEKHGLKKTEFKLSRPVMKKLISDYAREPGVRIMEQHVAKLCRKAALHKVTSKKSRAPFAPTEKSLEENLGPPRFRSEKAKTSLPPGVVTGLAWTSFGGEILYIETLPLLGAEKGRLKLTGQLGDVMNESANIAYSYVKKILQEEAPPVRPPPPEVSDSDAEKAPPPDYLSGLEVHLHLPAGGTPKDGPSAGVAMALALYGLANKKRVRRTLAMTGELSLTGKVLPVGGIKEKVLAAKRAGIKTVILPKDNEKDLKDVSIRHRKGLRFFAVSHFNEVLKIAL